MKLDFLKKIDFKSQKVQAVMLIILIGALWSFLWYNYIILEKRTQLGKLLTEYEKKQNELNNIYAMRPQLTKLRQNVARMNVQLDSLRSIFPDKKEIPRLIREITNGAVKTTVFTRRFNPLPDVEKEYYIENRYAMTIGGGYHEVAAFFNYLANFGLIINLTNVSIRTNPDIVNSIKEYEEHGGSIQSVITTFNMTTFSSRK
jgi:type IV pilus assembly protein PilO